MNRKLIADAGSTKVEWALLDTEGRVVKRFTTRGLNALLAELEDVNENLQEVKDTLEGEEDPQVIYYYGAGCATELICAKMTMAIHETWPEADVKVSTDLLGAARALFGKNKGIACILGTGSNSCLYNGEMIVSNVPSLGYVLGDEGSGAALGKRLVRDAFKGQLPESMREKFLDTYELSLPGILNRVYRSPAPNKFLASLVPFLHDHLWNPYIYSLVLEELTSFIKRNVAMYRGAHSLPLGFTGSIAFNFDRILHEAAASQGYRVEKILPSPLDGMITYHTIEEA